MNSKFTDLFFDLDHTLWDFDRNSALTFEFILKKHKVKVSLHTFLEVYQPINLKYWKLYREEKINKEALRFARLNDTFVALKMNVLPALIAVLAEEYITYLTLHNHLFDGTISVLKYLKTNYRLHIITNGFKEVQTKKLKQSNIFHFFETVTDSEMVGVKKPNPLIFNYAIKSANTTKQNSMMIGDNYEADIQGALNFGMDAICFNYHKETLPVSIKQITSLTELKSIL